MNGHDRLRHMLPLAAAGALSDVEQREVQGHAAECGECASELQVWQGLSSALRRLPTPVAPPAMVQRARAAAQAEAAARASRHGAAVLVGLALLAWALAGSAWFALDVLGFNAAVWFAAWAVLSTATAGTAAALLIPRRRTWRPL